MDVRPPRWTVPVWGPRVRISAGLVAWLAVAVAVVPVIGEWRAAAPLVLLVAAVASTAVHEGAHAWAARSLGYEVGWVVLGGLAGMTAYLGRDDRPLERAAVALAGPAASAALVLALLAARPAVPDSDFARAVVDATLVLNCVALVANLIPVGRTDGALCLRWLIHHSREQSRLGQGEEQPLP
jgi:Zn-dependent protease